MRLGRRPALASATAAAQTVAVKPRQRPTPQTPAGNPAWTSRAGRLEVCQFPGHRHTSGPPQAARSGATVQILVGPPRSIKRCKAKFTRAALEIPFDNRRIRHKTHAAPARHHQRAAPMGERSEGRCLMRYRSILGARQSANDDGPGPDECVVATSSGVVFAVVVSSSRPVRVALR